MKTHKDLDVWKNSVDLVTDIYNVTKDFPREEIYGLTNQLRRVSVSIPSNIAEGAGRNHNKEFIQFLYISSGSLSELETQLIICEKIQLIKKESFEALTNKVNSIRSQLFGLIKYLKNK